MRRPKRPPAWRDLITARLLPHIQQVGPETPYRPWDEFRRRPTPAGLSPEEHWAVTKLARAGMRRELPLMDISGEPFSFALPDEVLRSVDWITRHSSGQIIGPPSAMTDDSRDRYIVSSLMAEAITSSQMEGAATTFAVAKEMLRTGRRPRTHDERMIVNNYQAMRHIGTLRGERLTPELVCEIHRIVTEDTLDDPAGAGRLQLPGEPRVVVADTLGEVLHQPPPAEELPERLARLCAFANGEDERVYVPPAIRAIIVHFMLAYDHPFRDGNGRTARALFYYSMLNQGFWLIEFVSISRLLKGAQARYGRSFLHSEDDEGDLTYFTVYQLEILKRAITDLHDYIKRKAEESDRLRRALSGRAGEFNHRQLAILDRAIKQQSARFTVASHASSHNVASQTARTDLRELESRGLLLRVSHGRGHAWVPVEGLANLLSSPPVG
ncbi:Fic family protein [Nonomuraea sp. NPDC050310]|uniref:Fic family protein n=1 Tax=Nonomuraea sp. NPDC050310 TaxID=3154935 RepID=UPI0033D52463